MIYFIHPKSKEELSFVASLGADMMDYINKKFNTEQIDEIMDASYIMHSFTTDS